VTQGTTFVGSGNFQS